MTVQGPVKKPQPNAMSHRGSLRHRLHMTTHCHVPARLTCAEHSPSAPFFCPDPWRDGPGHHLSDTALAHSPTSAVGRFMRPVLELYNRTLLRRQIRWVCGLRDGVGEAGGGAMEGERCQNTGAVGQPVPPSVMKAAVAAIRPQYVRRPPGPQANYNMSSNPRSGAIQGLGLTLERLAAVGGAPPPPPLSPGPPPPKTKVSGKKRNLPSGNSDRAILGTKTFGS